jgi:hypothetical protein
LLGRTKKEDGMGRRWTAEDIANLKKLAQQHPLPLLAEKMDRSVGAVVFKAHKLKVPLLTRRENERRFSADPGHAARDSVLIRPKACRLDNV